MGKHLENELDRLKKQLLSLSVEVESALRRSVRAINSKDVKLAEDVIKYDRTIDLKEVEVEENCLKILALHQPVAIDLRLVVAALKINNDLERIGDLAVNISERAIYLARDLNPIEYPFDFESMAVKTIIMLNKAIDALMLMDANLAKRVCKDDDEIDEMNRNMYGKIFSEIRKKPEDVDTLIHYLSISRHLERIADYATNISEDIIYMIDGEIVRHKPENFKPI